MTIWVSRLLIYKSEDPARITKALLNRYVKGRVVHPNGDSIEEKFIMDDQEILKAVMDDLTKGGQSGKV